MKISEDMVEVAAKAAFRAAQSEYRAAHDHFPLHQTWETTTEDIRGGWRDIARAVQAICCLEARADTADKRVVELVKDVAMLEAACDQARLALAGMVSVQSALDRLDCRPLGVSAAILALRNKP